MPYHRCTPLLREHYPPDKLFEEILGYIPSLSPELEKIDSYLEDEKLYRLIKNQVLCSLKFNMEWARAVDKCISMSDHSWHVVNN